MDEAALARNLAHYGPFAAVERVLMALVKAGADRQAMHERLRQHALVAWKAIEAGQANPLGESLAQDTEIRRYLTAAELQKLMDASRHTGDAPRRARLLADEIRAKL